MFAGFQVQSKSYEVFIFHPGTLGKLMVMMYHLGLLVV
jgi:hypothetical protein